MLSLWLELVGAMKAGGLGDPLLLTVCTATLVRVFQLEARQREHACRLVRLEAATGLEDTAAGVPHA